MVATNQIKKLRESNLLLGDQPFSLPLELFKNTWKTCFFVAEVQDSNSVRRDFSPGGGEIRPKQPVTP